MKDSYTISECRVSIQERRHNHPILSTHKKNKETKKTIIKTKLNINI